MTVDRQSDLMGPYLLPTKELVVVEFSLDPAEVRAVLPPMLAPAESSVGFALLYTSAGSEVLPPSSAFYVGVFLEGRDAPDGSPGIFVAEGYYSNEANLATSRNYSARFSAGYAEIEKSGRVILGRGGPRDAVAIEISLRQRDDHPTLMLGTHQYFGERPGGLTTYSLAFAARLFDCETVSFRVFPGASRLLQQLTPENVIRASFVPGAPLNFSKPRPIANYEQIVSADAAHIAVVDVLGRLGRGAVVVGEDGAVFFSNQQGREVLGTLVKSNRLEATGHQEQARLAQLIGDAANSRDSGAAHVMTLSRPGGQTVLVQAANYRGGWNGNPTALLVVSDPHSAVSGRASEALELLGLIAAEVRIATEVGKGRSAAQSATALGLTENTVRSALKVIYAKLAISNRTELANLLAQVQWPSA